MRFLGAQTVLATFLQRRVYELTRFLATCERSAPVIPFLLFRPDFNVIERGVFFAIGNSFDADSLPGMKCQAVDPATRGRISTNFRGWQMIAGHPMIDESAADQEPEFGFAIFLVEVDDVKRIAASAAFEPERSGATLRLQAFDGFAA
jgi:hypothetical protein